MRQVGQLAAVLLHHMSREDKTLSLVLVLGILMLIYLHFIRILVKSM